ncbi:MAG: hypothetical protein AAGJ46_12055 [Planctomycetota bacterium]
MASGSQQVLEDIFPELDERLENLVMEFIKKDAALKKAEDKRQTAYDALKEAMRERELDEYRCYRTRYKVKLGSVDPRVAVKPVGANEPSPYRPTGEEDREAEEQQ